MDWLTFVAELVKALAWPPTLLTIFVVLRGPIPRLIPLLERLRYRELEVDFGRRLEEAAAAAMEFETRPGTQSPVSPQREELVRLIAVSPRAAILEAWIQLEQAAMAAARRRRLMISSAQLRSPHELVQTLEETGVITANQAAVFHQLRGLRNSAAHAAAFSPSPAAALEYVHLATALAQSLAPGAPGPERERTVGRP